VRKRKRGQFIPVPPLPKWDKLYIPHYELFHDPDGLCHLCGLRFGERFSPVTTGGFWFHYDCGRRFLGER